VREHSRKAKGNIAVRGHGRKAERISPAKKDANMVAQQEKTPAKKDADMAARQGKTPAKKDANMAARRGKTLAKREG
jgi:hypothetical protein